MFIFDMEADMFIFGMLVCLFIGMESEMFMVNAPHLNLPITPKNLVLFDVRI